METKSDIASKKKISYNKKYPISCKECKNIKPWREYIFGLIGHILKGSTLFSLAILIIAISICKQFNRLTDESLDKNLSKLLDSITFNPAIFIVILLLILIIILLLIIAIYYKWKSDKIEQASKETVEGR